MTRPGEESCRVLGSGTTLGWLGPAGEGRSQEGSERERSPPSLWLGFDSGLGGKRGQWRGPAQAGWRVDWGGAGRTGSLGRGAGMGGHHGELKRR